MIHLVICEWYNKSPFRTKDKHIKSIRTIESSHYFFLFSDEGEASSFQLKKKISENTNFLVNTFAGSLDFICRNK